MPADLFDTYQLGALTLANRMVMAPMTRNRADADGVPTPAMTTYYAQRASAGLIIGESAPVSAQAIGYPNTPNLYTDAQTAGWLRVNNAIHAAGGKIFAQLQHCGRISHPSMQPDDEMPVAPSAIRPKGQAITTTGMKDFVTPRALETAEVPDIVEQFRQGAERAKQAGFDGVEVHGANGYIIDQFLRDGTNRRTDAYGGSLENRMRLLNEILEAVATIWPANRIGLRLTPENSFNDMSDSDPQGHFESIVEALNGHGLAYLHVLEGDMMSKTRAVDYATLRSKFAGPYIANNGYDRDRAQRALAGGDADLIAFGVPFLANPDLVRRYKLDLPLNNVDFSTFYGGTEIGYTDYPVYRDPESAAA